MKDSEKEMTTFEYFLFFVFSLVPAAGLSLAVLSITLGVMKRKIGGWKLILIGVVGILSTHFFYPTIGSKFVPVNLHRCVTTIEFYKQVHGQYPKKLEDLFEGKTGLEMDRSLIRDNSRGFGFFQKIPNYYYGVLPDGKGYYLLGLGPDQIPFTSDDVCPDLTPEEIAHSGFRKKDIPSSLQ